jgi:hypothetical protein
VVVAGVDVVVSEALAVGVVALVVVLEVVAVVEELLAKLRWITPTSSR